MVYTLDILFYYNFLILDPIACACVNEKNVIYTGYAQPILKRFFMKDALAFIRNKYVNHRAPLVLYDRIIGQ